jgi:hypothetical protein
MTLNEVGIKEVLITIPQESFFMIIRKRSIKVMIVPRFWALFWS